LVERDGEANDPTDLLTKLPLFHDIDPVSLRGLAARTVLKHVEAGEYLCCEGERPRVGLIVLSGRLAVVKSTSEGKELTLDLLSAGDCSGMVSILEDSELDVSIRGQIESRVLTVDATSLQRLAEKHPALYRNALLELSARSRRTNTLALGLAHARVEKRIVAALLSLVPRVGRPSASSQQAKIFMTRKELAELTGTTPETAIRTTKHMEREGLLDLTRPGIIKIVDLPALEKYLNN
jgi:CRP/FNR family transcriptional regulator